MSARPRLLATDLDGTLLRSDGSLSTRTRDAIAAAAASGVPTLFVTARPPRWLDELAHAVGEHGVAICGNGAFVYDVASRTVSSSRSFDRADIAAVVTDLRAAIPDVAFAVERADGMGREPAYIYAGEFDDGHVVGPFAEIAGSTVGKLLARSAASRPDDFLSLVAQVVGGRVELGFSGAMGLAEMTAPGVTKATGLAAWCDERSIRSSEVWACGDMPNDLPMLAWAGRSFAVANAHPEVLAAATDRISSNDEDGVASLLESFAI
ncbi:HAD family hydrolase [Aeromicrobium sp.]|uniref:HAD family hydrolase n=1 Tax=Aeromicrobium sp. TaxID=1871063 RepID=UPI001982E944|nr:HAD family hydrolase [Aeromicrobium sp.]MBC7633109.1 HAD family hydrolase [Aeromicrobium sp.]